MTRDIDLALGADASDGSVTSVSLSKAPHILVAGMTGAGKSVLLHDLICQTIRGRTPKEVLFVFIDPKRVEFGVYKGLPHAAMDPQSEPAKMMYALDWAASEMVSRFKEMERNGWRDAADIPWARIVVVVDELANLILRGKRFERPIIDIASMGRAAGVHLILATQRPDAKVINGLIRANVPTRVALPTFTQAESRIILDMPGSENLSIPQRLVRLPGEHGLRAVNGRNWRDMDIEATLAPWRSQWVTRYE